MLTYNLVETIRCVLNEKRLAPSHKPMSLDQQEIDLALKSPNMTDTAGLRALISDRRRSKFVKTLSGFSLF